MRMQARLIWITPDAEAHIAYCARVSNPSNQDNPDFAKLLKYCKRKKHWSVFEMANACLEVKTSIAVAMQMLMLRIHQLEIPSVVVQDCHRQRVMIVY